MDCFMILKIYLLDKTLLFSLLLLSWLLRCRVYAAIMFWFSWFLTKFFSQCSPFWNLSLDRSFITSYYLSWRLLKIIPYIVLLVTHLCIFFSIALITWLCFFFLIFICLFYTSLFYYKGIYYTFTSVFIFISNVVVIF